MLLRLTSVGVAWLIALGSFAALVQWSAQQAAGPRFRESTTALARSLNVLRPPIPPGSTHTWAVTKATSALRELVVEVDALEPQRARAIAEILVSGLSEKYDEILVYVHALDSARDPVVRRIEWTPHAGYLASTF